MARTPHPAVTPGTLPLGEALDHSTALAALMARVQSARERFELLRPALPPALAGAVRPGALDEESFTLLAQSSAAAAKLRQCLPALAALQAQAGLSPLKLRVKVLPRGTPG
jgi:hypothetical protein